VQDPVVTNGVDHCRSARRKSSLQCASQFVRFFDSNAEAAHAFSHFRKVGFFKHPHFVRPPALRAAVSRIEQPLLLAQGVIVVHQHDDVDTKRAAVSNSEMW